MLSAKQTCCSRASGSISGAVGAAILVSYANS
jgi:hypothetical protein